MPHLPGFLQSPLADSNHDPLIMETIDRLQQGLVIPLRLHLPHHSYEMPANKGYLACRCYLANASNRWYMCKVFYDKNLADRIFGRYRGFCG
jgi:hypothetical protein